jgi:Tfp pilus assembly protein PilO|tara:strand:+ start:538 stop:1218 length:681 start_codon:yes stop_codon:yes gene_type:complete
MDLKIDLKNLDINDIKAKVLQFTDKKTLIKIGISLGAIIVFLIIYYSILNPLVNKKKLQLNEMNQKKEETAKFINEIKSKKNKIKKLTPTYEKYSTLFHTKAEVEGLYETLSYYAGLNGLVISKIEKKDSKGVTKAEALEKASKDKKKKKKKKASKKKGSENMAYYKIPVTFEITGNFLGYIKFKRSLSLSKKMLNFDKESIKVVKGDTTGAIKAKGLLTIVGLNE